MRGIPIKVAIFYQSINLGGKQVHSVMKNDNRTRASNYYTLELIGSQLFIKHQDGEVTLIPTANIKEMQIDTEIYDTSWDEQQNPKPAAPSQRKRGRPSRPKVESPVSTQPAF
ncbi:MAG: hypothetical protein KDD25_05670 [Bdellovibrionales bacterium]|nr:hypothetical protein [Bdellovibrionales bacterium]